MMRLRLMLTLTRLAVAHPNAVLWAWVGLAVLVGALAAVGAYELVAVPSLPKWLVFAAIALATWVSLAPGGRP